METNWKFGIGVMLANICYLDKSTFRFLFFSINQVLAKDLNGYVYESSMS